MKLWEYPNINDVTTTPDDAPVFEKLARRDPDVFKSRVKLLGDGPLEPASFSKDPDEVFLAVEQTAQAMSWTLAHIDRKGRKLEAVAITKKLRFRDDIVVEVREEDDGGIVHVRSRSRLGRKDFGVNESRIRAFLKKLTARLQ